MYLKILHNVPWLHFKTGQVLNFEENKVEFLEEQFHNKNFPLPTKRKLSFLLNFLHNLYNE